MPDKDLRRAKEIFFQYACNHFHLDRGVDAEEYKTFDISDEQEEIWTREYVSYWMSKLSTDDFQAVDKLSAAYAAEALPEMFRISELGDSLTKLRYANAIWDIAWGGVMSPILRERARRKAISLWQSLLKNPIELTPEHRKQVSDIAESQAQLGKSIKIARESRDFPQRPTTFQAKSVSDYILTYAKSKLRESKKRDGFSFLIVSLFMSFASIASAFSDLADKVKRIGKK